MTKSHKTISFLLAAAVLATSITALSTRATNNENLVPSPTIVAIADISRLINGSDERKAVLDQQKKRKDARVAELEKFKADIDAMIKAVDLNTGPDAVSKQAEILVKKATFEAQVKAYEELTQIEGGDAFSDLYAKVIASIETTAKREGYQLVLADDRDLKIPKGISQDRVINAMSSRKVLFADSSIDITERVLTAMNNEYNAGKSK